MAESWTGLSKSQNLFASQLGSENRRLCRPTLPVCLDTDSRTWQLVLVCRRVASSSTVSCLAQTTAPPAQPSRLGSSGVRRRALTPCDAWAGRPAATT
jgi:hypothetical protein